MVTARLNSFFRVMKPSETMVLVMVVPTLAPIIMGIALLSDIEPVAINATAMAVVAELLWMSAVTSKPMNKPVNGLDVVKTITSAASCPRCWSEDIMSSSAKRKISNAASM
ncbi:MAG: hypothetical protein UZ12_BCD005001615 [Bacteroidetes bacterium OLB12]|nr:MAG: hypothetical protein UZ12_BCD005001615 [Bacteroidetes bacterium OLB12]